MSLKKIKLDGYLVEVFNEFIKLKDDDVKKSKLVFQGVFEEVQKRMATHSKYFEKYSKHVALGGSVNDGVKVSKLDEFDMDIVLRLPICYDNDTIIEKGEPGYVKIKLSDTFDKLKNQNDWDIHKEVQRWSDGQYLLQNEFRHWMQSILDKALNDLKKDNIQINGTTYLLSCKQSGPAFTLMIRNVDKDEKFNLDIDLVPVIRFMLPRWPLGYRTVESRTVKDWFVVPKPNKTLKDGEPDWKRSWRLSFQDFEKEMMKNCHHLKTIIRLIKKLRDSLRMCGIASYYIKTLFLWELHNMQDTTFWQNKLGFLFQHMVKKLYDAILDGKILYFWNDKNNLISALQKTELKLYSDRLKTVLDALENNDIDIFLSKILTEIEFLLFKQSDFYKKRSNSSSRESSCSGTPKFPKTPSVNDMLNEVVSKFEMLNDKYEKTSKEVKMLSMKVDTLESDSKSKRQTTDEEDTKRRKVIESKHVDREEESSSTEFEIRIKKKRH